MRIMAIDPGPEFSAFVQCEPLFFHGSLDERKGGLVVTRFGIRTNYDMRIEICDFVATEDAPTRLVIEQIASMGMAVGKETFETCVWTGRFMEVFGGQSIQQADRIPRLPIKVHLCGTAKAKDANVRQALIDRFGGSQALQKAKPAKLNRKGEVVRPEVKAGALAGISSHCWAALAVAAAHVDRIKTGEFPL